MLWTDPMERGQGTVEYVVYAVVAACLLYRRDVRWLFDDADHALIARRAGAIDAGINIGNIVANGAEPQLLLQFSDGVSERAGVLGAGSQNMESQPLSVLGSDAGKFF